MRILYISNSTSGGGAPMSLFNLVDQLKDRHEVAVVLPSASGMLFEKLTGAGIRCYTQQNYGLDIWPRWMNPVKTIGKLRQLHQNRTAVRRYIGRILDDYRPDIVHTNVGPLAIAYEECRRRGIPHVWHMREYQSLDFSMKFFPTPGMFRRMIHSEGNYNIAITEDIFDFWKLRRGVDRVVYNSVARTVVSDGCPDVMEKDYFLYAARVERAKGLMTLLRAFRRYRQRGGDRRLLVVGRPDGLYSRFCRLYVALTGIAESVIFMGYRTDVHALMARADAFIMSSRYEGFGLTTVEAMMNGCLVIGRDTAGTREQFDRGLALTGKEIGLRFKDVSSLTLCLESVTDRSRAVMFSQMKERAASLVRDLYAPQRYAAEVEQYYKDISRV